MRLPWNRKYLEIGFHVILTAGVLVLLGAVVFHLSAAKNVILGNGEACPRRFCAFFLVCGHCGSAGTADSILAESL